MSSTILNTTFRLKRGTAARWAEVNPILDQGEPGFVYDLNLLKIGDGVTPWNNLPYIQGQSGVINFDSMEDFPEEGQVDLIYKAANELNLYQFNPATHSYEKLNGNSGLNDIQIINGGNA